MVGAQEALWRRLLDDLHRGEAPVIPTVDAAAMRAPGHAFYRAANGVWLTDHVGPAGSPMRRTLS
jgi:RNA:NAD 2'-phosphotransferase (TPT1/KptA family)